MALHLCPQPWHWKAGTYPDHPLHPEVTPDRCGLWYSSSCSLSTWGVRGGRWIPVLKKDVVQHPKGGWSVFPSIPCNCPSGAHPAPPRMGGGTARAAQAGVLRRLQLPVCHKTLAMATVWGGCKGFWEAAVNYPTCTLQPFLVFATGEKSSFRLGRGAEQSH